MKKFSEYLKSLRENRGVKQYVMAERLGITAAYLVDLEKGRRNPPNNEILSRVIEVLDLTETEKYNLLDLAADERDENAYDITEYLNKNTNIRNIIRQLIKDERLEIKLVKKGE